MVCISVWYSGPKSGGDLVKKAGYTGAFGTKLGTFQSVDELFTLPRVRIGGEDSVGSFASKLPWQ